MRVARASYTRANFDLDGNVALSGGQHIESWKNSLEVGINNDVPFRIHTGRHGAKNRIQAVMEANEPAVRDVFSNECYPNVKKHTTTFIAPDGTLYLDSWGIRSVTMNGKDKMRWQTTPESVHCCCCWHPGPFKTNASLLTRDNEEEFEPTNTPVVASGGTGGVAVVATVVEDAGGGVVSPMHGTGSWGVAMEAMQRDDFSETLRKLKALLDEGILSQEEFDVKKAEVLKTVGGT